MSTPPASRRSFEGLGFWNWLVYRATWLAIAPLLRGPLRLKGFGHQNIPRRGKMLLLPNHLSMLDPFLAGWLPVRPCRFMASAQPLKLPVLGAYLRALGAYPKKKFIKDKASLQETQRHYDAGHLVTIFPEGTRSWDGRTREIGDGIGRLVKRMGARVVLARLVTAYYFWPRWARYPRFVPVHIEYVGPLSWDDAASPAQIARDIREGLACDQRLPPGAFTFGFRMAHGLPAYLWACPSCFAVGGLEVDPANGNAVCCRACGARWAVTVDTRLVAQGDHESLTVAHAHDRLVAQFGARPIQDAARFQRDGVALACDHGEVIQAREDQPGFDPVARGPMQLTSAALTVGDWSLPLRDIVAVSVELGNKVQVRAQHGLFRLTPTGAGVLLWGHFVQEWAQSVQGRERVALG